jgi:predicted RND superfamily exporter protein
LTTLVSFGNLAFSAHPGTASMGRLLTIGVLLTLATSLIVLPALLDLSERRVHDRT